ncbi:MAG: aminotransferase class V-fold PLP-dependent enzyme [Gemmatimonadaceae bacterium]
MTYDLHALRDREFPWASRGDAIYLNNASTGPLPARTVKAVAEFNELRAEPWRITDEHQFGVIRRTRELVAQLIGASPAEIALMVNTSYGINLAARALPLKPGDIIVAPDREFPANVYPWMALERSGVTFELIPCHGDLPDFEALLRALDRPKVRVLTVSWVSFATGYRMDLASLGRACRERGVFFVVDAIQGLGPAILDVKECFVDVLACGAQKWLLSPWGTGFVYVREQLVRELEPQAVGWLAMKRSEDFTRLVDYEFEYFDDARRFEVITLPFQDFAGFNASLELIHEMGPTAVASHIQALLDFAVDWVHARRDMRLVTPSNPALRAGILSVAPDDARSASARLTHGRVVHSLREGAIRLAPHCYNTRDELRCALELIGGSCR